MFNELTNERVTEAICFAASDIANAMSRPSVLYRPKLSLDGNQWCALLGSDLQVGLAAFGDTPEAAMNAFDVAWRTPATPPEESKK
jgi:hypothetical protein